MKNRLFSFHQKSGLCGSYVVLCCATGGNKNERNKRTVARKHNTARGQQNELERDERTARLYGKTSRGLGENLHR